MATAATHTPFPNSFPIEIEWCDNRLYNRQNYYFDGTNCVHFATISEVFNKKVELESINNNTELTTSKLFIKQIQKILNEYKSLKGYFQNVSESELLNNISPSIASFLEIKSDIFSAELTKDESVFFTIKKGDFTFYIEQYFDDTSNTDEFILTSFNKKNIILNKSGLKSELIAEINKIVTN